MHNSLETSDITVTPVKTPADHKGFTTELRLLYGYEHVTVNTLRGGVPEYTITEHTTHFIVDVLRDIPDRPVHRDRFICPDTISMHNLVIDYLHFPATYIASITPTTEHGALNSLSEIQPHEHTSLDTMYNHYATST